MAPTALVKKKAGPKPKSQLVKDKKPPLSPEPVAVLSSDDEASSENLLEALKDRYDLVRLAPSAGNDKRDEESEENKDAEEDEGLEEFSGSEEEDEGDEEEDPGSGSEGESSGDEDILALDELEDVELHPDAVPRRGVKVVDNKVRAARV
jgi:hypothetical protein